MATVVQLNQYREKLATRQFSGGAMPQPAYVAFGDGGHNLDGTVKAVDPAQTGLTNELLRVDINSLRQDDTMSVTAVGVLAAGALTGETISEVMLVDDDGDGVGVRNFAPKIIDADESYAFELVIRF